VPVSLLKICERTQDVVCVLVYSGHEVKSVLKLTRRTRVKVIGQNSVYDHHSEFFSHNQPPSSGSVTCERTDRGHEGHSSTVKIFQNLYNHLLYYWHHILEDRNLQIIYTLHLEILLLFIRPGFSYIIYENCPFETRVKCRYRML
jgi:hypothetical protein